jgi:hypothetical protein
MAPAALPPTTIPHVSSIDSVTFTVRPYYPPQTSRFWGAMLTGAVLLLLGARTSARLFLSGLVNWGDGFCLGLSAAVILGVVGAAVWARRKDRKDQRVLEIEVSSQRAEFRELDAGNIVCRERAQLRDIGVVTVEGAHRPHLRLLLANRKVLDQPVEMLTVQDAQWLATLLQDAGRDARSTTGSANDVPKALRGMLEQ